MKVEILDKESFAGLAPSHIEHYLASSGWEEFRRTPGELSIWDKKLDGGKKSRVWVPLNRDLGDFEESMSRLIKAISTSEDRSQLELLEDLDTITIGDVVRVKTRDRFNKASTSLLLDNGITLLSQAQRMASAAACAAIEKRAVFPYSRPKRVTEYLRKLRIGQTERGSYLIKLISPVESDVPQKVLLDIIRHRDTPFERQVVVSLMQALEALFRISQEAFKRNQFYIDAYQEAVSEGVSANLCEALAIQTITEYYNPVEISVTWSSVLDAPQYKFQSYSFDEHLMPYISEAGRLLRERNPEEIVLMGRITALRRKKIGDPKTVTLEGEVEGRIRSVRITLSEEAYALAIQAHDKDSVVSVNGVLQREGNFYVLHNPTNFQITSIGQKDVFPQTDAE